VTWSKVAAPATAGTLVMAAGCPSSTTAAPSTVTPPYGRAGPDSVGVATLDLSSEGTALGEHSATAFYPADAGSLAGHAPFRFSEASTPPVALQRTLPPGYNTTATVGAFLGPPLSKRGPYPDILFSHRFEGEPPYYSDPLVGIASWGYVVVSADYRERGVTAQAWRLTTRSGSAQDTAIVRSSLGPVEQSAGNPDSPLFGVVDLEREAGVGHSAGGGTAFDALDSPSVKTAVGWAPVAPTGTPSSKPVLLGETRGGSVVAPSRGTRVYNSFRGPNVRVENSGEDNNSSTDICTGIRSGGGLISYAISAVFIRAKLAKLGINGCQPADIDPVRFWPIVQFYTVLQLENQLDPHTSGSVPFPALGQFPGFTVKITRDG
jgi:hypothetical protein